MLDEFLPWAFNAEVEAHRLQIHDLLAPECDNFNKLSNALEELRIAREALIAVEGMGQLA